MPVARTHNKLWNEVVIATSIKLDDTDGSNYLELDWNEDDSSDRNLYFKVNSGNRTIDLSGDLTLSGANKVATWETTTKIITPTIHSPLNTAIAFQLQGNLSSGNFLTIDTEEDAELTATSGEQAFVKIAPEIEQTSTAAYVGILLDVTESSVGSGTKELMALRVGAEDRFTILNSGALNIYESGSSAARYAQILQSTAEGVASSSDLRIGLDETLRRMIVCDRGDIAADFGLAAATYPTLHIGTQSGTKGISMTYKGLELIYGSSTYHVKYAAGDVLQVGGSTGVWFISAADKNAGHTFRFMSGSGDELTDSDAEQAWVSIEAKIRQTGTANYVGLLMDITETAVIGTADKLIALRVGADERFGILPSGALNLYESGSSAARYAQILQSTAEGIASSSDLRIGTDESSRNVIICDRGDIATDLGLSAQGHNTLYIFNANADVYGIYSYASMGLYDNYCTLGYSSSEFQIKTRAAEGFTFEQFTTDIVAGHLYKFVSSANIELTDTDGEQAWMYLRPYINQTDTGNYIGFLMEVTETSTGSGTNELMALRVGGTDKFTISNAGVVALAGALGVNGVSPPSQVAHIGDTGGDDAAVVNAILVVLENLGFIAST